MVPLFFWAGLAGIGLGPGVFLEAEVVGGLESAGEDIFVGCGQHDVRGAGFAPATVDGEKHFREILDKELLLLGREHEVAVALLDVGKGGEDVAADAEISGAKVGALFGIGEAEGNAAEVGGSHGGIW
jgi:hypothetical protein